MKESALLKTALICSLIGLFALYFISEKIEVKDYKPSRLNENVGDDVRLTGTIIKISQNENVVFLEVDYQSPITIVMFTDDEELGLKINDSIEVFGEVQEYKGKNEIIAQKVRVIK